jgi:hypothetical protein
MLSVCVYPQSRPRRSWKTLKLAQVAQVFQPSSCRLTPILAKNSTARALASGSGGGANLHALPFGVCWTIRGTLISAACAGFAGRLRGRLVTMVMVGMALVTGSATRRECCACSRPSNAPLGGCEYAEQPVGRA